MKRYALYQCDQDGEKVSYSLTLWPVESGKCGYCDKIVSLKNGFLELADIHEGESLWVGYPGNGSHSIAYMVHTGCGPDVSYAIDLPRLVNRVDHWKEHIGHKVWRCGTYMDAIEKAAKFAGKPPRPKNDRHKLSGGIRARVLERDGFQCRRCAHGPPSVKLVIDHIVAVANGGKTVLGNLQTLCWDCNSGKRDHEPHDHDLKAAE